MITVIMMTTTRPSQLAELSRSEFDTDFFFFKRVCSVFCDIRDQIALTNILRQNKTSFCFRKGIKREEIKRKLDNVVSESFSISSLYLHFLSISSFSLHFLSISSPFSLSLSIFSQPGCHKLCNPDDDENDGADVGEEGMGLVFCFHLKPRPRPIES